MGKTGRMLIIEWRSIGYSALRATAFLTLLVAAYATRYPPLMGVYLLVAACLVLSNLNVFADVGVRERTGAIIFVLVLTIMLPLSVFRSETALLHYATSLISLGVAFVLTQSMEVYFKACRLVLVAAQAAVLGYLFYTGLANFPLEDILPNSSSNGVTSYLVVMQANYCLTNYLLYRRASLLTAATTLFICFVGWGRGSLLAASALFVIGVLFKIPGRNLPSMLLRVLLVGSAVLVAYLLYSAEIVDLVAGTKVASGIYDESRVEMITDYFGRLNGGTLWTGAEYEGTSIADLYNGNPHNSFIRAHHIFGLPYLLAIMLVPVYMVRKAQPLPVKLYAAGIFAIVLFRAFSEPILFPTLFDYFYFSACLALARLPARPRGDAVPAPA
jgi:hypothetical protein